MIVRLTAAEEFELFWKEFDAKGYNRPATKRFVRDLWLVVRMYDLGARRNLVWARNRKEP